jgi:hypothetical protein
VFDVGFLFWAGGLINDWGGFAFDWEIVFTTETFLAFGFSCAPD